MMTTVSPITDPGPEPGAPASPRIWPVMLSLVLALIPMQLDGLVTATAIPTIAGDLGGFDRIAWIATAYLLAMAIGTIGGGRLGDMFGRRRMLLAAMAVFFAGSLWAGISTDMTEMIVARAVQGLGGGMAFTTLLATVADIAPPEKRSRYQGIFGAIAPFSMIVGPWVGGLITDHLGWRWIFLANLPLIAVAALGVVVLLRLPARHTGGRVDVAGIATISAASAGIVLAVSWGGQQYPWWSWQVIGAAVVGLAGIVATIVVERRAAHPILPLHLLMNRPVGLSLVVMALAPGAVMMAALNFVPVFLQIVQHRSAGSSGVLLLPMLMPAIVVAVLIGRWTTHASRFRPVLIAGTAVLTVGSALLASMGAGTSAWQAALYMIVGGAGIGLLFQTPLVLIQNAAPAGDVGAATGAASYLRSIGGAVGVGALGALFATRFADHLTAHTVPGVADLSLANVGPDSLSHLSSAARAVVVDGAAAANSALFWTAAVIALVALIAAIAVPRVPRTAPSEGPEPEPEPQPAIG